MKTIDQIVKSAKLDPLGEAFLITAIHSYSLQVLDDDSDWGNSLVSKDAWQLIAQHNLTLLEQSKKGE